MSVFAQSNRILLLVIAGFYKNILTTERENGWSRERLAPVNPGDVKQVGESVLHFVNNVLSFSLTEESRIWFTSAHTQHTVAETGCGIVRQQFSTYKGLFPALKAPSACQASKKYYGAILSQ
jgi:hypothetical protein